MDEAFLALLEKKDFAYITVKEICEAAGVNRSTFYLHYETLADLLAERSHGMPGHVNRIPLNDVVESEFKPSKRVAAFQKRLESHGLTATVRRSLGGDIDASCGQLRRKEMKAREGAAQ